MSPVKDFASFLQAARIVLETNRKDSWRFLALGHGQQRGALMDSVADLVEKGVVAFPEAGLEVLPYVRDAQIGVLMTNPALGQEGCSNTILEYMACGLPVICSDSGGNREVVLDSETGYVIPPLDANSLANRIMELQDKPTLAAQMGIAGREYFSREFTVQNLVQKTISLYEELII
jgi:glycosyltransferase involved in cell wall biosynthesis